MATSLVRKALAISAGPEREYFYSRLPTNGTNNLKQIGLVETPLPLVLENPNVDKIQIFEKIAVLTSGSTKFDEDEASIRTVCQRGS